LITLGENNSKLGIQLAEGSETEDSAGYPRVYVVNIKPGSLAEGKLFPGDMILAVSDKPFSIHVLYEEFLFSVYAF